MKLRHQLKPDKKYQQDIELRNLHQLRKKNLRGMMMDLCFRLDKKYQLNKQLVWMELHKKNLPRIALEKCFQMDNSYLKNN